MLIKKALLISAAFISIQCANAGFNINPMDCTLGAKEDSIKISIMPDKGDSGEFQISALKVEGEKRVPSDDLEIQNTSGEVIKSIDCSDSKEVNFVVKFKGERPSTKTKYYVTVKSKPKNTVKGMGVNLVTAINCTVWVMPAAPTKN